MKARIIERVVEVRKDQYKIQRGIKLTAQNRDERELLDKVMEVGVEVDSVGYCELDLRLCK